VPRLKGGLGGAADRTQAINRVGLGATTRSKQGHSGFYGSIHKKDETDVAGRFRGRGIVLLAWSRDP